MMYLEHNLIITVVSEAIQVFFLNNNFYFLKLINLFSFGCIGSSLLLTAFL